MDGKSLQLVHPIWLFITLLLQVLAKDTQIQLWLIIWKLWLLFFATFIGLIIKTLLVGKFIDEIFKNIFKSLIGWIFNNSPIVIIPIYVRYELFLITSIKSLATLLILLKIIFFKNMGFKDITGDPTFPIINTIWRTWGTIITHIIVIMNFFTSVNLCNGFILVPIWENVIIIIEMDLRTLQILNIAYRGNTRKVCDQISNQGFLRDLCKIIFIMHMGNVTVIVFTEVIKEFL